MRRKYLFVGQVLILLLVAATLYYHGHRLARPPPPIQLPSPPPAAAGGGDVGTGDEAGDVKNSGVISAQNITRYINTINDPKSTDLPRLQCPDIPSPSRYDELKATARPGTPGAVQYFFAIDLRNSLALLPRLLGSVVEAIRFLGAANCALSIIEGNSDDGTFDVLQALRPSLDALTTTYYLRSSPVDPQQGDRIAKLAQLRNMALQPLRDEPRWAGAAAADTTVVFLNDVAACTEDVLELVLQRRRLGADMTCGLDWVYVGHDPTFYDVWVARGMNGDSFFEIPADGNWNSAWNLFWNDDAARFAVATHRPLQVFSCWNGAAVFTAAPIVDGTVRFRGPRDGECKQGEPQLFCKDMWFHGFGKIAVVPSVNLEYSDENARKIKDLKGYTSRWVSAAAPDDGDGDGDDSGNGSDRKIAWQSEPPALVKCIPSYEDQSFRPWNETLG